ncbi:hypothetical protein [Sorangium sp. So ce1151]|uniref:hypothetical protein n=1 Tax=Sorangium sp. So ce1151 TaxID=3133332 RepID=UPI003F5EC979
MTDAPDPPPPQDPPPQAAAPLAAAPGATPARVVPLASGRAIEIAEDGAEERIQIRAASGQLLVSIRLTDEGPVLSLSGASLEIAAAKTLSLSCETLRIQAAQDAAVEVGGSLHERVRGSVVREAGRSARTTAREVKVEASPGGVEIRANDDVDIVGERVRLNSEDPPMPLSWEEFRARQALAGGTASPPALAGGQGAAPGETDDRAPSAD